MREVSAMKAEARARAGKGLVRSTRSAGRVPGVVYGGKEEPLLISIEEKELVREYHRGAFLSRVYEIDLDGKKHRVLPRDVQLHPVSDRPVHVDLMRISADSRIRIFVPVHFKNHDQSPGIKKGGVLNVVRHEVEFYCPADSIPEQIIVDLAGQEIATSIHIESIALPEGIRPVIKRNFTVATIAAPTKEEEVAPTAAAAAAPAADAKAAAPAAGGKAAPAAAAAKPAAGGKK